MWQELYEEVKDNKFMVIAVAMDSRADAARPWIEEANPSYVSLIDADHVVADLYHMVNVPQAVWIGEDGRIVRPVESAGAYEGFRSTDLSTGKMPEDVAATTEQAKSTYVAAIRDWAINGAGSEYALGEAEVRARMRLPADSVATAHAAFRMGQVLLRKGKSEEADKFLQEAIRLHPDSWNMWRQWAEPNEMGLAAGPDFWKRVEALGEKRYYPPVDMKGMPG